MPLPKPNAGESKEDFLGRCMANDTMREEYPDNDQRYAVCNDLWSNKSEMPVGMAYAPVEVEVKAIGEEGSREILHMITMATEDRTGDIVDVEGVDLTNYKRNPVVLIDHDYRVEKIIGRAVEIEKQNDRIYARTKFRDTELAETAFQLAKEKLGGWSIGFRPLAYEQRRDKKGNHEGFNFSKVDLLEYSLVAIPMHQDIVNNAITRGLVTKETASLFFKIIDSDPPKPVQSAADRPKAEADHSNLLAVDTAVSRASRQLVRDEAARKIRKIFDRLS